jgi:inner membrane protein
MPLPIAHGLLAATIVAAIHPQPTKRYCAPLLIGFCLASAADFDFLPAIVFHSMKWHRGFSHSLFFALVVGLVFIWFFGRERIKEAIAYGLVYASHGILDYATTDVGGGVELLFPFSTERFELGWWGLSEVPTRLPPIGILKAVILEMVIFTPLLILVLFWKRLIRHEKLRSGK